MKLQDALDAYYDHSGTTSENVRKLAFAGIAVVWIFSGGGIGAAATVRIDNDLVRVLFLLVLALAIDFIQYVYLAVAWWAFSTRKERALQREPGDNRSREFDAPYWINRASEACWAIKILLIVVAYVNLLGELGQRVL